MTINEALLREAIEHIEAEPQRWNQQQWVSAPDAEHESCGTKFCLAGWVAFLTGYVDKDGLPTEKGLPWMNPWHQRRLDQINQNVPESTLRFKLGPVNSGLDWHAIASRELDISNEVADRIFSEYADCRRNSAGMIVWKDRDEMVPEERGLNHFKKLIEEQTGINLGVTA